MSLSDDQIRSLIECNKRISRGFRPPIPVIGRYRRADLDLAAVDSPETFFAFFRQSTEFPENFSVGLDWTSPSDSGRICLIRCNGPHGELRELPTTPPHHFKPHIHLASQDALESGLRPESAVSFATEFSTFEEAVVYFVRTCSIIGAEQYFGFLSAEIERQLRLFEGDDDQQ